MTIKHVETLKFTIYLMLSSLHAVRSYTDLDQDKTSFNMFGRVIFCIDLIRLTRPTLQKMCLYEPNLIQQIVLNTIILVVLNTTNQ